MVSVIRIPERAVLRRAEIHFQLVAVGRGAA
jgi:hypothetical protein